MAVFSKRRAAALLLGVVIGAPAAAQDCPSTGGETRDRLELGARELRGGRSYPVLAGGDMDLQRCRDVPGEGWIIRGPDFELHLSDARAGAMLDLRVAGACDTVLLVNDGAGEWHFSDDAGGGQDPALRIAAADGVYDIWVGTFDIANCDARLSLSLTGGRDTGGGGGGDALDRLDARLGRQMQGVLADLSAGRQVALTQTTRPFVAGLAAGMLETCSQPFSAPERARLAAFAATGGSGTAPTVGAGDALRGALYDAGARSSVLFGCGPDLDRIGRTILSQLD